MDRSPVLVLGIGNLLWADDGFGVCCVERLHQRFEVSGGVRVVDGGVQGLSLVPYVCAADRVLVLDAVDFGVAPGTLRVLRGSGLLRAVSEGRLSLHQAGLQDVLALAALLGQAPREVVLVGVQPAALDDFGGGLTPSVSERVTDAVVVAAAQLAAWGFAPRVRGAQRLAEEPAA